MPLRKGMQQALSHELNIYSPFNTAKCISIPFSCCVFLGLLKVSAVVFEGSGLRRQIGLKEEEVWG